MYNHLINFVRITRDNFPNILQGTAALQWIRAITKPVRCMYKEFKHLKDEYILRVSFNSQSCKFQAILNLRFDTDQQRIRVVDAVEAKNYIYASEDGRKRRIYGRWEEARNYIAGQFAIDDRYVYVATDASTGARPSVSPAKWAHHTNSRMILRSLKSNITTERYIIFVPAGLVYDANEFTAILDYYRMWGLSYAIKQY